MKSEIVVADKGYISKEFSEEMENRSVVFIAVKRKSMIKNNEEAEYYRFLSRVRRKIEILFSVTENFELKFIRAVSRKCLVVKIILILLSFNIYQQMR